MRPNRRSFNFKRHDFKATGLQVRYHGVEIIPDTRNVFTQDPAWPDKVNNSKHLRPEVTRILCAELFTGDREGLAGKSAANEIDSWRVGDGSDVVIERLRFWPVFEVHLAAEVVNLASPSACHSRRFEAYPHAADAAEQVCECKPAVHSARTVGVALKITIADGNEAFHGCPLNLIRPRMNRISPCIQ